MLRNRDITRKNRANLAVKACMYSKIASSTIKKLEAVVDKNNSESSALLEIAKQSTTKMVNCFLSSQTNICNTVVQNYATQQFGHVISGLKLGENVLQNENVSEFIADNYMLEMCKSIIECKSKG